MFKSYVLSYICMFVHNQQMSAYYLDVLLKVRDETLAVITKLYFQGSIEHSLLNIFGEIGGQTELEITKFDHIEKRAIIKVPEKHLQKIRVALTLIGNFQDIPCHFHVLKTSKQTLDF